MFYPETAAGRPHIVAQDPSRPAASAVQQNAVELSLHDDRVVGEVTSPTVTDPTLPIALSDYLRLPRSASATIAT